MRTMRHFLTLGDLHPHELETLFSTATHLKRPPFGVQALQPLVGRHLVMLFEKSSTRTRVSFEIAMHALGGNLTFLRQEDSQVGRGETLADTARVLSQMADVLVIRTSSQERVEQLAEYSDIPVINGLSDRHHPCQLLADVFTYQELRGSIENRKVAWIGDGNNVCNSYVEAAQIFGFHLHIACPENHESSLEFSEGGNGRVEITRDPVEAARDADLVVTDTWMSMGDEAEKEARMQAFAPYQVNAQIMKYAKADALFMHCLPAHRGFEVSDEVLDGPQSAAWQEAGNRLHTQKALLHLLFELNASPGTS